MQLLWIFDVPLGTTFPVRSAGYHTVLDVAEVQRIRGADAVGIIVDLGEPPPPAAAVQLQADQTTVTVNAARVARRLAGHGSLEVVEALVVPDMVDVLMRLLVKVMGVMPAAQIQALDPEDRRLAQKLRDDFLPHVLLDDAPALNRALQLWVVRKQISDDEGRT